MEELNQNNFFKYLGQVYVKEHVITERTVMTYQILALFGLFFLILSLEYIFPSILKTNKTLNDEEFLKELRSELSHLNDTCYKKYHIYLTKKYLVYGLQALLYEEIIEGYIKEEYKYGIKAGENLVVKTKNNKEYVMGSVAGNKDILHEVLNELQVKNVNIKILNNE